MADGYATIEVTPVTTRIGAQVDGVDLTRPITDEQRDEIRAALVRHLVLFFRDQDLDDDQHVAFASHFGEVAPSTPRSTSVFDVLEDTPDSPPKADFWHTDVAFLPEPPDIAVLSMRATPDVGGDTMWCSLYEAHDGLSPALQELIADLELDLHLGTPFKSSTTQLRGDDYFTAMEEQFTGTRHPLVRIHPESGRPALFLCGAYVRGIVGMHQDEADALLALLRRRLDDPNGQVRWRWRPHDVAMWDERCTNHRAMADHYPAYRMVRRCLAGRGVPVGRRGAGVAATR